MTRRTTFWGVLVGALAAMAFAATAAQAAMTFLSSSVATQDLVTTSQTYSAVAGSTTLIANCTSTITLDVPRVGPFNATDQIGTVLGIAFRCGSGQTLRLLNSPRVVLGSATATTISMQVVDAQIAATTIAGTCLFRGLINLTTNQGSNRGALGGGSFSSVSGPCTRGATASVADVAIPTPLSWTGTA